MKKSVQKLVSAWVLIMLPVAVWADDEEFSEQWECKLSGVEDWDDITIRTDVGPEHKTGSLTAAGVRNESQFSVQGLERIWSFSSNSEGGYDYTFVITASKQGKFYDFAKAKGEALVAATNTLECRREDD